MAYKSISTGRITLEITRRIIQIGYAASCQEIHFEDVQTRNHNEQRALCPNKY